MERTAPLTWRMHQKSYHNEGGEGVSFHTESVVITASPLRDTGKLGLR